MENDYKWKNNGVLLESRLIVHEIGHGTSVQSPYFQFKVAIRLHSHADVLVGVNDGK